MPHVESIGGGIIRRRCFLSIWKSSQTEEREKKMTVPFVTKREVLSVPPQNAPFGLANSIRLDECCRNGNSCRPEEPRGSLRGSIVTDQNDQRVCPPRTLHVHIFFSLLGACKVRHLCAPRDWSIISIALSLSLALNATELFWPQGVRQPFVVAFDTRGSSILSVFLILFSHLPHRATLRKHSVGSQRLPTIFNPLKMVKRSGERWCWKTQTGIRNAQILSPKTRCGTTEWPFEFCNDHLPYTTGRRFQCHEIP